MMRAIAAAAVLGVLFGVVLIGCSREEAAPQATAAPSGEARAAAPTREVSSSFAGDSWDEKLAEHIGETVTLAGKFQAHDDRACAYAPQTRTRALRAIDWAFEKDGRCVWVANGMAVFGEKDIIVSSESVGRAVEITAVVKTGDDGLLYLDYVEGRPR